MKILKLVHQRHYLRMKRKPIEWEEILVNPYIKLISRLYKEFLTQWQQKNINKPPNLKMVKGLQ